MLMAQHQMPPIALSKDIVANSPSDLVDIITVRVGCASRVKRD